MEQFDPYRIWLGIPPQEQPADYYRLLGIGRFESDSTVISNAADRQMMHVRGFQSGEHSQISQQILNELSAARLCLLDAQQKAEYDSRLRNREMASAPPPPPVLPNAPQSAPPRMPPASNHSPMTPPPVPTQTSPSSAPPPPGSPPPGSPPPGSPPSVAPPRTMPPPPRASVLPPSQSSAPVAPPDAGPLAPGVGGLPVVTDFAPDTIIEPPADTANEPVSDSTANSTTEQIVSARGESAIYRRARRRRPSMFGVLLTFFGLVFGLGLVIVAFISTAEPPGSGLFEGAGSVTTPLPLEEEEEEEAAVPDEETTESSDEAKTEPEAEQQAESKADEKVEEDAAAAKQRNKSNGRKKRRKRGDTDVLP